MLIKYGNKGALKMRRGKSFTAYVRMYSMCRSWGWAQLGCIALECWLLSKSVLICRWRISFTTGVTWLRNDSVPHFFKGEKIYLGIIL